MENSMKPELQIFIDGLDQMRRHAARLNQDAMRLTGPLPYPEAIVSAYGLDRTAPTPALIAELRRTAQSCERRITQIEAALHRADALDAFSILSSAMMSGDRALDESWPALYGSGFVGLSARLDPVYWRAVPLFALDSDPPDPGPLAAFSRWLASNKHPWSDLA